MPGTYWIVGLLSSYGQCLRIGKKCGVEILRPRVIGGLALRVVEGKSRS